MSFSLCMPILPEYWRVREGEGERGGWAEVRTCTTAEQSEQWVIFNLPANNLEMQVVTARTIPHVRPTTLHEFFGVDCVVRPPELSHARALKLATRY